MTTNTNNKLVTATNGSSLADILERVLDKGIVIAGDISVSVGSTELLSIKIRLLISSVDKAREIGINWWESDPYLSTQSNSLMEANQKLLDRVASLESEIEALRSDRYEYHTNGHSSNNGHNNGHNNGKTWQ
ncbi:MAG: gas vesicle protein [Okeania sp. SIO2F4]|uniref:gas vesicle protein n=1 Tax=Okeania sp. SIO2F4 TaxID=2607790 RepID=UPI00142CBD3C|nr:gas vesicle protein [Okeania sp. SIO2F4]NES07701.1 gas vesicle protein [Okeania sp. SIO2F4]